MVVTNPGLLYIVEAARLDTYERLCRNYASESGIRVILDRRGRDRRRPASPRVVERRLGDLHAWRHSPRRGDGYVVVQRGFD